MTSDATDLPPLATLATLATLAAHVGAALRERGETVAVAESSAGGLVSAALLALPGASAFFKGGAVVYSRRAGKALLGLVAADMAGIRGETEPFARLIAGRVRDSHHASWGLGETGAAGPSPSPYGDVPGRVCLAVVGATSVSRTVETGLVERPVNMELFARQLLLLFDQTLRST